MKETPILTLEGVSCGYAPDTLALRAVSLSFAPGEKVALLGRNGAGKSTLLRLCVGLSRPSAGRLCLHGAEVQNTGRSLAALRRSVGLVFQDPDDQLIAPTVLEEAAFGLRNLGHSREEACAAARRALEQVGLSGLEGRAPYQLSGGEKQRLAIAGVLGMEPELMLLDEPSAALDGAGRQALYDLLEGLHRRGIALAVATHDVDFAWRWAQRVVVLSRGTVAADGAPEDIFFAPEALEGWGLSQPVVYSLGKALGLTPLPRSREELIGRISA